LGGATREGEEEDPFWCRSLFDQVRDSIDEGPGLSGAGSGDDEERPGAMGGGCRLFGVQLRQKISRRRRNDSLSCRIDD
jgi:hypothetical protein